MVKFLPLMCPHLLSLCHMCMHPSAILASIQDNMRYLGYLTCPDHEDLFEVRVSIKEYNKFKERGSKKAQGQSKPAYLSAMSFR